MSATSMPPQDIDSSGLPVPAPSGRASSSLPSGLFTPDLVSAQVHSVEPTPETPWCGLRSFTEQSNDYFFGRERELQDLFERVMHRPLTVLFGQSGLGKTSLIRAALIPRLRKEYFLPVLIRLDHAANAPCLADQVLDALRATGIPAVRTAVANARRLHPSCALWLLFHDPELGLLVRDAPEVVLIFDQFEEMYTIGAASDRRAASEASLQTLADLVENRVPAALELLLARDEALADRINYMARGCRVLITLRDDFLDDLERSRKKMPSLMDNRLELRPLAGQQAFEAVYQPGQVRCRGTNLPPIVSEQTAKAIVRYVTNAPDDTRLDEVDAVPPLLSLFCAELNTARIAAGKSEIAITDLRERADGILSGFPDRCFARHRPEIANVLQRFVEEELLSPNGYRQCVNQDTFVGRLLAAGISKEEATAAIARLIDDRLLVAEDRGRIRRIELTHDILAGPVRDARDRRRRRDEAARQLAELAREGADQSRQQEEKARRLRGRLIAACALLFTAELAAAVALWANSKPTAPSRHDDRSHTEELRLRADLDLRQRRLEEESDSRSEVTSALKWARKTEVAAIAREVGGHQIHHALALLADCMNQTPMASIFAEMAVPLLAEVSVFPSGKDVAPEKKAHAARFSLIGASTGPGEDANVRSAKFSVDGKRVLTIAGNETSLWDLEAGTLAHKFEYEGRVVLADFADTEVRILTQMADRTARLWAAGPGASHVSAVCLLPSHDEITSAELSSDGTALITVSPAAAWLWDAEPQVCRPRKKLGPEYPLAFSHDGKRLLTTSREGTRIWDLARPDPRSAQSPFETQVASAVFIDQAGGVLTASQDGTVRAWDSANQPWELAVSRGGLKSLEIDTGAMRVLGVSADQTTTMIWDARSGELRGLIAPSNGVRLAHFRPGPRPRPQLVTVSGNDLVVRDLLNPAVDGPPPAWFAQLLRLAGREYLDEKGAVAVTDDELAQLAKQVRSRPFGETVYEVLARRLLGRE